MKSLFVYLAAIVSGLLLIAALVVAIVNADERIAWLGAALANLPLPVFIGRTLWMRVVRTSDNLPLLLLLSAAGVVIAAWESFMERTAGWPPSAVAVAGASLLLLYVFWCSRFGRYPSAKLSVGNKLPDFELAGLDGGVVRAADFRGRPAIFLFYRGNRCPFCVGQVHEITARHGELESSGVRLALISPQAADETRALAADTGVFSPFLVDPDNAAAKSLDIAAAGGATVLPTVIVTNANGTILFSDQTDNYRVRPEPDLYISILKRAGVLTT